MNRTSLWHVENTAAAPHTWGGGEGGSEAVLILQRWGIFLVP